MISMTLYVNFIVVRRQPHFLLCHQEHSVLLTTNSAHFQFFPSLHLWAKECIPVGILLQLLLSSRASNTLGSRLGVLILQTGYMIHFRPQKKTLCKWNTSTLIFEFPRYKVVLPRIVGVLFRIV